MIIQGVLFGFLAAVFQSLSYVFSRSYVARPGNSPVALFGQMHVLLGVIALAVLPLCWQENAWNIRAYGLPMAGAAGFYLIGQLLLFQAMKLTDASRISPLLGLKILMLSIISVSVLRVTVTPLQWLAVAMSIVAALGLNYSGGRMPWTAFIAVLGACFVYSLSDLSIVSLTRVLAPDGGLRGIILATCLTYIAASSVGLAATAFGSREDRAAANWGRAAPVALVWFLAMICLYACFNWIGALFGNIMQSTRGPLSILLGAWIASLGHHHLEKSISGLTLIRRIASAILMCAAIALFMYEKMK